MIKISAVIITKNEERNIERCLRSLEGIVAEIIVVDSLSTDATVAICSSFNARVISNPWLGYGPQKNLGIQAALSPYILSMDADEALDETLKDAIKKIKEDSPAAVYEFSRINHYYGKFLRHGIDYPDRKIRLFPKDSVEWNKDLVHEKLSFKQQLPVVKLPGHLLHYTFHSMHDQVTKINHYTTLGAQLYWEKGRRSSWLLILFNPLYTFIRTYFIKGGFLDGGPGFIMAVLHTYSNFLKYSKLWEIGKNKGNAAN